jgi:hypothetical protein
MSCCIINLQLFKPPNRHTSILICFGHSCTHQMIEHLLLVIIMVWLLILFTGFPLQLVFLAVHAPNIPWACIYSMWSNVLDNANITIVPISFAALLSPPPTNTIVCNIAVTVLLNILKYIMMMSWLRCSHECPCRVWMTPSLSVVGANPLTSVVVQKMSDVIVLLSDMQPRLRPHLPLTVPLVLNAKGALSRSNLFKRVEIHAGRGKQECGTPWKSDKRLRKPDKTLWNRTRTLKIGRSALKSRTECTDKSDKRCSLTVLKSCVRECLEYFPDFGFLV